MVHRSGEVLGKFAFDGKSREGGIVDQNPGCIRRRLARNLGVSGAVSWGVVESDRETHEACEMRQNGCEEIR